MKKLLAIALLAILSSSCSSYKEVELTDITSVEVLSLDPRSVALRIDARIDNPNGFSIAVEEPDVDLFINDKFIGKAVLDSSLVLDRKAARVYPVYLRAKLEGGPLLMMLLSGAFSEELKLGAKGTVAGRSGALKRRFPFEVEEMIDLSDE
ncbi:MAG: LEA type 2 family protein [Flavobacteriales bacterium]|nr:LEA type 2 family protein [Flavobacteriales bacterium]